MQCCSRTRRAKVAARVLQAVASVRTAASVCARSSTLGARCVTTAGPQRSTPHAVVAERCTRLRRRMPVYKFGVGGLRRDSTPDAEWSE